MTHAPQTFANPLPRARAAIGLAFFVNGFCLGSWTPEVPVIGETLGLTPATYGFMVLLFGFGAVVAMPLVGAFIAKIGSRPVTIVTHILLVAALFGLNLMPHPFLTAFMLFLFGIGFGGMDVAMNANAVSVERAMDKAIMSSCHGFWSLGAFAGAGIGGTLIDGFGALGHTTFVAAFAAATLLFTVPNILGDKRQALTAPSGKRPRFFALLAERRTPLILTLAIGLMALAGFVQEGVVIDWSAVYLRNDLGASIAASGFGFAAFSFTMALFRFFGDGIRERFGAVRTVRVSLLVALCGLTVLVFATNLPIALFGFVILGIGLSNVVPIAFSAAGNVRGLPDGTGISIASAIAYSGGLIAPAAVGLLADAYGFSSIFAGLAVISIGVILAAKLVKGADRESAVS